MRRLAVTMLLGVLLLQSGAAPAPPSRGVQAEVVVALGDADGSAVTKRLLSPGGLAAIVASAKAKRLDCIQRGKDPADWLAGRLKVSVDEKRRALVIRVVNCPAKDALPLLGAVVEGYKSYVSPEGAMTAAMLARYEAMLALQAARAARGQGQANPALNREIDAIRARQARQKDLVIQPPRLIPDAR